MRIAHTIKITTLSLLLLIEGLALGSLITTLINTEDFILMPPLNLLAYITSLILVMMYTYSLTVGAWNKWEFAVVVPLPLSLAVFIMLTPIDLKYAVLGFGLTYLHALLEVNYASKLKNKFIKFDANLILRSSSKGLIFAFAVLGAVLTIFNNLHRDTYMKVLDKVTEESYNQMSKLFRIENTAAGSNGFIQQINNKELEALGLTQEDLSEMLKGPAAQEIEGKAKQAVRDKVNQSIKPYESVIPYILGLLTFTLIQFLTGIASFVYLFTIPVVFAIAKKTHLFHIEIVQIEKEELKL